MYNCAADQFTNLRLERERDQTHKIYTNASFLKDYIQSFLPTSKENLLITLNCTPYILKTLSCTLQETQLCCYLLLWILQF